MKHLLVLLLVVLAVAACGAEPTPTPDLVATHIAVEKAAHATMTAEAPTATNTPFPTLTDTPPPTLSDTPTATATPTSTESPTSTPSPTATRTRHPTSTPRPTNTPEATSTPKPKPTKKPANQALVKYLKEFAPIADHIWANFPGDSGVSSKWYVDHLEPYHDRLDTMTVPSNAEAMHLAFQLVSGNVMLWHSNRWGADLHPSLFNDYLAAADAHGNEALSWYYSEYLPRRGALLKRAGLSAKNAGFNGKDAAAPVLTPAQTVALELLSDSEADFSSVQGQNNWEYLFSQGRDSFNWTPMAWDGSCWRAPVDEPKMGICKDQGAAGIKGDIAWMYKSEATGRLVFKIHAHKVETSGDDIRIEMYRHLNEVDYWYLDEGETEGFTERLELDATEGELFFFMMQVSSTWREFVYDPNVFRVQVYLKE